MLGFIRRMHPSAVAFGAGIITVIASTVPLSAGEHAAAPRLIARTQGEVDAEALAWVMGVEPVAPAASTPDEEPKLVSRQSAPAPPRYEFIWPVTGAISQGMSATHPTGIDIAAVWNEPVRSVRAGTVKFVGGDPCCVYGNYVVVEHDDGWSSLYGHLNTFKVKEGDRVRQGDVLGLAGSTGKSTGVHVHLELHLNGYAMNPINYLEPTRYYVPPPVQIAAPTDTPPTPTPEFNEPAPQAPNEAGLAVSAAIGWMRFHLDEGYVIAQGTCYAVPTGLNWTVSCQTVLPGCDSAICESSIEACVIGSVYLVEAC